MAEIDISASVKRIVDIANTKPPLEAIDYLQDNICHQQELARRFSESDHPPKTWSLPKSEALIFGLIQAEQELVRSIAR
ncbi:hypothetical protein MRS76_11410 [Rhizobiaceae bacterium n13]|uniref:hypothetical protein n=1 Tax=Ferirhizobium litorale TaxID=2927786 RepID=UPI0024B29229|nr:hypothetical protein [Fererhizobium litorale]MDI7862569.1 hypothetical protein [Fererhizobium litorale]